MTETITHAECGTTINVHEFGLNSWICHDCPDKSPNMQHAKREDAIKHACTTGHVVYWRTGIQQGIIRTEPL